MQSSFVQIPVGDGIRDEVKFPKDEATKLFAGPVKMPAEIVAGQEA